MAGTTAKQIKAYNAKNKNSSLKSKGARYATTSSKGVTKYYAKGSDAPGYSDTFQGKGTMSKGVAPIAIEGLNGKATPADIPTLPTPKDPGDLMGMNNQALANTFGDIGLSLDSNKQFVYDPKKSEAENAINQSNTTAFQQLMSRLGMQQAPESKTNLYADTYGVSPEQAQRDYQRQRKDVQNYTGQLNSIVSNSQAQQLALEGQGRGQTSSFVGGEQARINREAAIAALPVQAQLATSQANLEEATRHLDNLFKLKSEDADAQYNFKNKLIDAVFNFASEAQKNVLDVKLADIKEKKAREDQNRSYKFDLAKTASEYGLAGQVSSILNLDEKDPNFDQKYLEIQSKINKPQKVTGTGSTGSPTGAFTNDLDAMVGTVLSTIPSKFGQQTFNEQIARARNDADKLNILAAQVLQGQPAEFKNDFRNQAVGISQLDKAIALLDQGVQTGVLQNGAQYAYNLAGKDFDPNLAAINGLITSAIQPYRNSVTGAAWGDQEDGEYQQLFGSAKYSPSELRQRLVQTKELLKSKSAEGLNASVNAMGTYNNPFQTGTYTPLPNPVAPQPTDKPEIKGFWAKVGNFLWGND